MATLGKQLMDLIEDACIVYAPWQWRDEETAERLLSQWVELQIDKGILNAQSATVKTITEAFEKRCLLPTKEEAPDAGPDA